MKVGNKSALLRLLDSNLAMMLDIVIDEAKSDGTWISSEITKRAIINKVGISPPTYFRYIKTLVSKEILLENKEAGRGVYKLNPDMLHIGIDK